MGGFAFEYVEGTEQLIVTQAFSDNFELSFHRIDDNRQMLVWHDFNNVGPQSGHAVIVDVSAAPALTVGPVADFVHTRSFAAFCIPVQLTGDGWLMHFHQGSSDELPFYMRFTISGLTITVTDSDAQSFQAQWAPGDVAVPDAIFEGHTAGPYNVFYSISGGGSWSGIDATHIMAPAVLQWGPGNLDLRYAIVDLTTDAVTHSFRGADLGFFPARGDDFDSGTSAWEPGPGSSYRWVFSDDNSVFMLAKLALTDSSIGGTIIISSADDPDLQISPLGRALDGKLWMTPNAETLIEHHVWTYADPTIGTYAAYSINDTAVTKYFYTNEARGLNFLVNRPVPAGANSIVGNGSSISLNDTHVRAEQSGTDSFVLDAPHVGVFFPTAIGGTPVDGYVVLAQTVGIGNPPRDSPYSIYLSVAKEVPLRPFTGFFYSVPGFPVPTAPLAVAFDATESINDTRDSYWHPITDYYWQFDDGQIAHAVVPTTNHTYRIGSIGRHTGDGWDVHYPVDISLTLPPHGTLDRFNPLLVVGSSAGYSDPAWHNTFKLNAAVPLTGGPADSGVRYY